MPTHCPGLADLIARLDRSVEAGDAGAITKAVKADLEHVLGTGALELARAKSGTRTERLPSKPGMPLSSNPANRINSSTTAPKTWCCWSWRIIPWEKLVTIRTGGNGWCVRPIAS